MSEAKENPRFFGQCTFNKATFTEATWATLRGARTWVRVCLALFFLAFSIYYLTLSIRWGLSPVYAILMFFITLVYSLLLPLNVHLIVRRQLKRMEEMGKADTRIDFAFHDDCLLIQASTEEKEENTAYDRIVRVQETKNLLLIWRRQRLYYFIEKATLSGGTEKELIAFLKEKNPEIKTR